MDRTLATEWAANEVRQSAEVILATTALADQMVDIANACVQALRSGGRVFFCGNGGSAADSQHLAAELAGKQNFDRGPLSGIALTVDTSALTAIGNDYGYEHVFSRQLRALAHPGDVIIGLSTSGSSKNVLRAFEAAKEIGVVTVAFTGAKESEMGRIADFHFAAPSLFTPYIQQAHELAGHIICGLIERTMFTPPENA